MSERGRRFVGQPSHLVEAHFTAVADPFDPERNPGGYVNLGTAENHLVFDLLEPRLAAARPVTADDTHYGVLHGTQEFRATVARVLGSSVAVSLDPEHLIAMSGTSAILDAVAYATCDLGDAVIVPAPFYGGFEIDFSVRAGATIVPAQLSSDDGFALSPAAVVAAIEATRAEGRRVGAVALISPHNPTARVHSADAIAELVRVTRELGVHLIVDEIYAMSAFGETPFASALAHGAEHVHVVWGFAKDFALSGFKVGILHTTNVELHAAVAAQAYLAPVSTDVQRTIIELLADDQWISGFLAESRLRLAASCNHLERGLGRLGLPPTGAEAGVFSWADLRAHLPEQTWEAEEDLRRRIFDEAKINIAPASVFHGDEPGWFRITHACEPALIDEALLRLGRVLNSSGDGSR
ncbi:hypothetical protein VV02_08020 [Luteipulveratus mongoliensis]|uniref:Aminotransferase class I/classII large domain-containing protein n=2 Tax=Luteipulveratus mongoliensis TaxID=571913 RepID=A0A0K1JQB9_9MICO|nr:hypothetical protein VV02_08020 [Luteipulveratus mongoliensis]